VPSGYTTLAGDGVDKTLYKSLPGYVYYTNVKKDDRLYLKCVESHKRKCNGLAVLYFATETLRETVEHNHPVNEDYVEEKTFKGALREGVNEMTELTLREVYNSVASLYMDAADRLPFDKMRHTMQRWRSYNKRIRENESVEGSHFYQQF